MYVYVKNILFCDIFKFYQVKINMLKLEFMCLYLCFATYISSVFDRNVWQELNHLQVYALIPFAFFDFKMCRRRSIITDETKFKNEKISHFSWSRWNSDFDFKKDLLFSLSHQLKDCVWNITLEMIETLRIKLVSNLKIKITLG